MERYVRRPSDSEQGRLTPLSSPPKQPTVPPQLTPTCVPQISPHVPATCTILKQSTTSTNVTSTQSNHPLMQYKESVPHTNPSLLMSMTKVPSNLSLERVITPSKMAALQARRGSGSSLTNLRSSLMADDNPRRGSAIGKCRTENTLVWGKS